VSKRRLDDLLVEEGLIDESGLKRARRHARRAGIALARAAVEERLLTDAALAEMLVRRLLIPRVDLSHEPVDPEAVREVPHDFADARRLLPLSVDRGPQRRVIRVAMADPLDLDAVEEVEMSTGCDLEPRIATVGEIGDALQRHYRGMITKAIPRRPLFGAGTHAHTPATPRVEPSTQPQHQVADEASLELRLAALVELLTEAKVVDREVWLERVRKLMKSQSGE
jgi:hypothetical protein